MDTLVSEIKTYRAMKYTANTIAKNELIELLFECTQNSTHPFNKQILERNNFSEMQWECFVNLSKDFELNAEGAAILLDEILAGRVEVPCEG